MFFWLPRTVPVPVNYVHVGVIEGDASRYFLFDPWEVCKALTDMKEDKNEYKAEI